MTVLLWVGIALVALVALAFGLRALGAARWSGMIRMHTTQLESGRLGARGQFPSPARYSARDLEGLPAPVQRYFRAVLTDGQPVIAAASIEMSGTLEVAELSDNEKARRVAFLLQKGLLNARKGPSVDASEASYTEVPTEDDDDLVG